MFYARCMLYLQCTNVQCYIVPPWSPFNFSCIPPWPALKAEGRQRHSEELQDKYIGLPNRLSSILLTELGELGIKATQDPKGPLCTWLLSTDYLKRISHITPRSALISLLQAYVHMDEFIPCSPWPICSQPKALIAACMLACYKTTLI